MSGFDSYRDPLNADHPNPNPDKIMRKEQAQKPTVTEAQRKLLERRYNLNPKPDPEVKMTRGKPVLAPPPNSLPA